MESTTSDADGEDDEEDHESDAVEVLHDEPESEGQPTSPEPDDLRSRSFRTFTFSDRS